MPTNRKYQEWQTRRNISGKLRRKRSNVTFWLSVLIAGLSMVTIFKNNPQHLKGLFNVFNFDISSIQSLSDPFVTDIDGEIIPGNSENIDKNQFAALDKKARAIKYYGNSVKELAHRLSQYAHTDLEKARIIYSWITENIAYDSAALFALKSGVYPDIRVEAVLNGRKTICSGYANLYQKIATSLGLKSVIVLGYAKGSDYIVGDNPQVNHAWNAVKIDAKWYLIDTTWGAGTVNNSTFNKKFNPLYFATPPEEFIYSHFPQKDKWQLLAQPYTRQQFDFLPEVSGALFKNDLQLISHKTKNIYTNNRLNITLKAPPDVVAIANLKSANSKLEDNYTLVQKKDGYITVNTAFPAKGNYTLDIFAKKRDNSKYYPHVVTYQIKANNSSEQFPLTYSDFLKNNGYLETPLTKSLNPHSLTYFKLRVDNATEVKVIDKSSQKGTDLIKYGNLFAGSVRVGSEKVVVFAKFPGDSRYWALLEFDCSHR